MKYWPDDIPQFIATDGYSETPSDGLTTRFSPELGSQKARRRLSISMQDIECTIPPLTKAQIESFWNFYHKTLAEGVLQFMREHPRTQNVETFIFREKPRSYIVPNSSDLYSVSMSLQRIF